MTLIKPCLKSKRDSFLFNTSNIYHLYISSHQSSFLEKITKFTSYHPIYIYLPYFPSSFTTFAFGFPQVPETTLLSNSITITHTSLHLNVRVESDDGGGIFILHFILWGVLSLLTLPYHSSVSVCTVFSIPTKPPTTSTYITHVNSTL